MGDGRGPVASGAVGDGPDGQLAAADALDRLIEACPSFLGAGDLFRFVAWSEEEGEPDPYLRASALAQHVVDLCERGQVDELPGLFATAEDLLGSADRDVVDLVRMGLFESLQNVCSHVDVHVEPGTLEGWLGPRGKAAWDELLGLWASAADRAPSDGPRVTEVDYLGVDDPNLRTYLRTTRRRREDGVLLSSGDVLRYEHWVADVTWRSPEARRRVNRTALMVGIVLALAVAIALFR